MSLVKAIDDAISFIQRAREWTVTNHYLYHEELDNFRKLALIVRRLALEQNKRQYIPDAQSLRTRIGETYSLSFESQLSLPGYWDAEHNHIKEDICEGIPNTSLPPHMSPPVFVVVASQWLADQPLVLLELGCFAVRAFLA